MHAANVMLGSFFANNKKERHHIYFMYSSVQNENLKHLETFVMGHHAQFTPVHVSVEDFGLFHCPRHFTIEIYFRLLIPQILPKDEVRALWLDVDLVVNGPLDEFYYQDFEENYFAACLDLGFLEQQTTDVPPGSGYINSGVISFNVPLMRQYRLSDYQKYYLSHKDTIVWPDQDILNGMFAGRIKVWNADIYNVQTRVMPSASKTYIKVLKENAKIIHYIGACKPWHKMYTNPIAELWDYYHTVAFELSPFYAKRYLVIQRLRRFGLRIFWRTPRRILAYFYRRIFPVNIS